MSELLEYFQNICFIFNDHLFRFDYNKLKKICQYVFCVFSSFCRFILYDRAQKNAKSKLLYQLFE